MNDCIFCKIIEGDIPSAKVYEDDVVYAFLDTSQVTEGHTLIIPRKHVASVFDYDSELAGDVLSRIPKVAQALQDAFPDMKGLNILNNNGSVAYQTVFHSHWHLLPRYQEEEGFAIKFDNNSDSYTDEEFQQRAAHIAEQIED